ncbi:MULTISPECIES: hypothetical protein [Exiguobacterium]|uniref:hypothetical protein n=1 Tax=Exiguobacterium TaxID=33986 RepID=UPI001BE66537|nr:MULTISPECIES: hypothetical protein [Exiguobacterium]MCT4784270.1 hypothetical protein [Exiguobacterium himgiriensis]
MSSKFTEYDEIGPKVKIKRLFTLLFLIIGVVVILAFINNGISTISFIFIGISILSFGYAILVEFKKLNGN